MIVAVAHVLVLVVVMHHVLVAPRHHALVVPQHHNSDLSSIQMKDECNSSEPPD